jgi:protein O-mannosyl-transferase
MPAPTGSWQLTSEVFRQMICYQAIAGDMKKLIQTKYFGLILLLICLVWTFLLYYRVLTFDFVFWDDNAYVYQNKDISELTLRSVSGFFHSFCMGMYQPVTMLSFSIENHFFGLNPSIFHATNLLFHLLNVCLVFLIIKKISSSYLSAFFVSLFFGIHPLHVESVAWISERKDVLYTFFYLLGLISYLQYLKVKKPGFWISTLVLFIISLLSKSAAVTFPLILILLHFYLQNESFKLKKVFNTTWPFFVLSILFGVISFISQKSFSAPDISHLYYDQFNKVVIAGFAYFLYIFYLIYPSVFSAVHPLPVQAGFMLPVICYICFFISIIILFLGIYFFRKGLKNQLYYDILFGFGFFTFTIFLILYNPASNAVYADRYTYLPYIGLFFILATLVNYIINITKLYKKYLTVISICIMLFLSFLYSYKTYSFVRNWQNSSSLWIKTTENEPSAIAYFSRAIVKKDHSDVKGAINDYKTAIRLNEHFYQAYTNIAAIAIEQKDFAEALIYLNKVISLNPSLPEGRYNRGLVYGKLNKIPESIIEYTAAISINPNYGLAYYSRANAYASLDKFDEAFNDVNICLNLDPSDYTALTLRGYLLFKSDRFQDALNDLDKAIELNHDYLLAYNNRSLVYRSIHDYDKALNDVNYVLKKEPGFVKARYNRGRIYLDLNETDKACKDLHIAFKAGITDAGRLIDINCL